MGTAWAHGLVDPWPHGPTGSWALGLPAPTPARAQWDQTRTGPKLALSPNGPGQIGWAGTERTGSAEQG